MDNETSTVSKAHAMRQYIPQALQQALHINRNPATPIDFQKLSAHLADAHIEIMDEFLL